MTDGFTVRWMWRDAAGTGIRHTFATFNPFRWSDAQSIPDTIAEMEKIKEGSDGGRPIKCKVQEGEAAPTKIKAGNVQELIHQLEAFAQELRGSGPPVLSVKEIQATPKHQVVSGAYLVYETDQLGALSIVWSRTKVCSALAFGHPLKDVPGFKFAGTGKTTLKNNIQQDKTFYYAGWCMFVKACKAFDCDVTDYGSTEAPLPLQLWLHYKESNKIEKVVVGKPFALPDDIDAIAAVHKDNQDFEAATLSSALFQEKAGKAQGYCVVMNRAAAS